MDSADAESFRAIAVKYGMASFVAEYPDWIIDKLRTSLWDITRDMLLNITRAYSIWPTNISEAYARRNYINSAIADCESIMKELELAIDVLQEIGVKNCGVVINKSEAGVWRRKIQELCMKRQIPLIADIPYSRSWAEQYAGGALSGEAAAMGRKIWEEVRLKWACR